MNNKMIKMYKGRGKFVNAYMDDAIMLSSIFNYKIIDGKRCGFPDIVLDKVLLKLEDLKISYQVDYIDKDPRIKDFKKINQYDKYYKKAKEDLDFKTKIDMLETKIYNSSKKDLEKIIELIDRYYERSN